MPSRKGPQDSIAADVLTIAEQCRSELEAHGEPETWAFPSSEGGKVESGDRGARPPVDLESGEFVRAELGLHRLDLRLDLWCVEWLTVDPLERPGPYVDLYAAIGGREFSLEAQEPDVSERTCQLGEYVHSRSHDTT